MSQIRIHRQIQMNVSLPNTNNIISHIVLSQTTVILKSYFEVYHSTWVYAEILKHFPLFIEQVSSNKYQLNQ